MTGEQAGTTQHFELDRHIGVLGEEAGGLLLQPVDIRMIRAFDAMTRNFDAANIRLGEINHANSIAFGQELHHFGLAPVNERLDRLEHIPLLRDVSDPTPRQLATREQARRERERRHAKARFGEFDDGKIVLRTLDHDHIDRSIESFIRTTGWDRRGGDIVHRDRVNAKVVEGQQILYITGEAPNTEAIHYNPEPTQLSKQAIAYKQIAMYMRLRDMFSDLGLYNEASVADVVLAVCGQRIFALERARLGATVLGGMEDTNDFFDLHDAS